MNEEKGHTGRVPLFYDWRGGQRSTSIQRLMVTATSCLAILTVLAYLNFESFKRWIPQAQLQEDFQSQAICTFTTNQNPGNGFGISTRAPSTASMDVAHITHSANLILPRDTDNDATTDANGQDADTQSIITDSDGTWVIVSSGDLTDQPFSQTTTTTIETVSLTDQVIVSYKTKTQTATQTATATETEIETETETETKILDHFITVTITGGRDTSQGLDTASTGTETATASNSQSSPIQDSSSTAKTASATSYSTTSNTPRPPSPQDPQTTSPPPTPASPSSDTITCPWLICAPTCPWTTCSTNFHPPAVMETNLCQMIDPCWLNGPDRDNKPPSQGGACACLCESGYCHPHMKNCAEWNCCHQCECFKNNPMSLQKGAGC